MKKKISKYITQVNNVFPKHVCLKIYEIFKSSNNWKKVNQIRNSHYSHVFKSRHKFMPGISEKYIARFYRDYNLSDDNFIISSLEKYVFPKLKKLNFIKKKDIQVSCQMFKNNCFLRTHFDHYAGSVAVTIYLNPTWKADWGGLLCVLDGPDFKNIKALNPEFNLMNILESPKQQKKTPHFVTNVQSFAAEPRYSITLFIK